MGADETGTLARLRALRETILKPLIDAHNGRIVKLMGDGLLVEFASAVDSVACAISWQETVSRHQDGSDGAERLNYRIGINLGDVIAEDGDIHGDGVNIAARLEGLAPPGGICLSSDVFRHAKGRVDAAFEDLGEQTLRNVAEPVRVFRIAPGPDAESAPRTAPGSNGRPSVAVLPFVNMSQDPEQAFFSDGISEEIITGLSRFRTLFVIARNSSFRFRDHQADCAEIGRTLGVQYIVEGSVRKAGNRVRISAQLVEAETGNHLWAERYDRELEDVFAVQDEVARSIVAVLPGRVQHDVASRAARAPTGSIKAYELVLQAKALRDGLNARDTARARALLERALALDPSFARAYMYLADTYVVDAWLGLADDDAPARSLEIARKGAALDNRDVYIQDQLGYAYLCAGHWESAEAQFERTLEKIVNEAESMAWCGYGFLLLGRAADARDVVAEAQRLDPLHPPSLDWIMGQVHFQLGEDQEVVRLLIGEALLNSLAHAFLVAAYAHLGRIEEARGALAAFIAARRSELGSRGKAVEPETLATLTRGYRQMWRREEDWQRLAAGLVKAGLPEG